MPQSVAPKRGLNLPLPARTDLTLGGMAPRPRLQTRFWVDACLARLQQHAVSAFVTAHGDDARGAVMFKINLLDGSASLMARQFNPAHDSCEWQIIAGGSEYETDRAIARQIKVDPDLWVIEVEDMRGRQGALIQELIRGADREY